MINLKSFIYFFILILLTACNNGTCNDGIQNQNETGLDCGGNCQPCGTCTDGIQNQDEEDIDCGGVCNACDVIYPQTGVEGQNVLYGNDTLNLALGDYSFDAEVPEGSSLKLELDLVSGEIWFYQMSPQNWTVSDYDNGHQTFEVTNPGKATLILNLPWTGGVFKISYFENGTALTKSKIVVWG